MSRALNIYIIVALVWAVVETMAEAQQRNEGQNLAALFLFAFLAAIPLFVVGLLFEIGDVIMFSRRGEGK